MGLMIKLFCAILVIGLAGLFVLKKPDGTPWLSASDFIPNTDGISADAKALLNKVSSENTSTNKSGDVYRWKDKNGQWRYSDTPPDNQTAENISVSGNLNSDLAEKAPKPTVSTQTEETETSKKATSILPATLSQDQVSKLIEDTNNVQQLIDDRQSQLEQRLK